MHLYSLGIPFGSPDYLYPAQVGIFDLFMVNRGHSFNIVEPRLAKDTIVGVGESTTVNSFRVSMVQASTVILIFPNALTNCFLAEPY